MLRLLIDDAIVSAYDLFSPLGEPILCSGKQMSAQAQHADALIIRSRTRIDHTLLSQNPNIKFIGSSVVGLDHVDQLACQDAGVTFYSAQGCNARSVAEYVISQLVIYVSEHNKSFNDITLGIVGVGQVGKRVAQMAHTLGIHCLLNDPPRAEVEPSFEQTELDELLTQSDIITFHTPLTYAGNAPSYHLLNETRLQYVRPTTLIINAARGGIIDESALLAREDLSLIIDCWENEPLCNPALLQRSRCATPHIAGHALDAKYRGGQMVAEALAQWIKVDYTPPLLTANTQYIPILTPPVQQATDIHSSQSTSLPNPIAELASCLQQAYDFCKDDQVLRSAINTQTSEAFAQVFEDYRRHYPERYEWHHIRIPEGIHSQTHEWLYRLGFNQSA